MALYQADTMHCGFSNAVLWRTFRRWNWITVRKKIRIELLPLRTLLRLAKARGLLFSGGSRPGWVEQISELDFFCAPDDASGLFRGSG
jgi:hypothetical protein